MADGYLDIDTSAMRNCAGNFDSVKEQASAAYTRLVTAMNRIGTVWGDDKFGQQFKKDYVDSSNKQVEGMAAFVRSLADIGDSMRASAKHYEQGENAAQGR
jgi:uncharacterized protein YukE